MVQRKILCDDQNQMFDVSKFLPLSLCIQVFTNVLNLFPFSPELSKWGSEQISAQWSCNVMSSSGLQNFSRPGQKVHFDF